MSNRKYGVKRFLTNSSDIRIKKNKLRVMIDCFICHFVNVSNIGLPKERKTRKGRERDREREKQLQ